jgi:hypothetical protein
VAAEVGDSDPVLAIQDALATFAAEEIVVVTHPEEDATWLEGRIAGNGPVEIDGVPVRRAFVAADGSLSFA